MILAFLVWLVMTVFPALIKIGATLFFVVAVSFVIAGVIALVSEGECLKPWEIWKKVAKYAIPVVIALQFIPDTKTSWYMVGAYATQTVVQSEAAQTLGSDGVDLMKSLIARAKKEIDGVDIKQEIKEAIAPKVEAPKAEAK